MSKSAKSRLHQNGLTRRGLLATASVAAMSLAMPRVVRAQGQPVKIGVLHPVTGPLAYEGEQCRRGALLAIEEINAAGGIKSMGGAKIDAILADAQSKPEVGAAEIDRLAEAGVVAVQGPYASGIALATTQAAAKHNLPHLVDVGVVDAIVTRGLPTTFRFAPGFGKVTSFALDALQKINAAAGNPAKTVVIVHEDGAFGSGMAKLLNERLPGLGLQVLQTLSHPTPQRDFTNIALQIRQANPDLIIPSNYKNDFILMSRTLQQQRVKPKVAIYAMLGGAASNIGFAKQYPEAAEFIMDCNHWYNPTKPLSQAFAKKVAEKGLGADLRDHAELFLHARTGGCAGACGRARPRQGQRGPRLVNLQRSHHALRSDQVREGTEHGRATGQHADSQEQCRGHLSAGIRVGQGRVPDSVSSAAH